MQLCFQRLCYNFSEFAGILILGLWRSLPVLMNWEFSQPVALGYLLSMHTRVQFYNAFPNLTMKNKLINSG
jgi:hypothetical protein